MPTIEAIFDAYRSEFHKPIGRWARGANPRNWQHSPIQQFRDFSRFKGKFMVEVPIHHHLPGINPRLIDQLQLIFYWNRAPLLPLRHQQSRLHALDLLQNNLGKPIREQTRRYPIDKMVLFDGSPQETGS